MRASRFNAALNDSASAPAALEPTAPHGLSLPEDLAFGGRRLGGVGRFVVSMEDGALQVSVSGRGLLERLMTRGVRMRSRSDQVPVVRC